MLRSHITKHRSGLVCLNFCEQRHIDMLLYWEAWEATQYNQPILATLKLPDLTVVEAGSVQSHSAFVSLPFCDASVL